MRTEVLLERAPHARDSRIVICASQDVEPILEGNKALRGEAQRHDCARMVARIPAVIIVRWANETGLRPFTPEFAALVARKLQDPDWAYLRTG
jgi:hypothetical protein